MNEAAVEGISQSRAGYNPKDEDFYNALRHSNEVFSTFKVHTFGVEMASKLFDNKGNLRSFDEWTKATIGIASHQVGSWLETEYNTAIIRAHQAADWQEFVRNKDIFPNLRWMMTTSPDPEDTHKHYWMTGLTLPIDDPFWNKHYPGDRWNCKCSLEATADPIVRPADIKEEKPQRGLDTNPGKTGELISSTHPYFPKDCSHCFAKKNAPFTIQNAFQRFFLNADQKKDCSNCHYIDTSLPIKEGYTNDAEFGTRLRISEQADMSEIVPNIRCAKSLLKSFPDIVMEIRPHVEFVNGHKNPEYTINGLIADRKGVKSEDGIVNGFAKAIKQGCKSVVVDLDFHADNFKIFRSQKIAKNLLNRKNNFINGEIVECYIVWHDKAVMVNKDDFMFNDKEKNREHIINKIEKIKE